MGPLKKQCEERFQNDRKCQGIYYLSEKERIKRPAKRPTSTPMKQMEVKPQNHESLR